MKELDLGLVEQERLQRAGREFHGLSYWGALAAWLWALH